MKKVIISAALLVAFTIFATITLSTPNTVLYLLNWGEYIDDSLVQQFEEEKHCQVVLETVTSSEAMYQKIISGTTPYDVAIPGDYMVRKLYAEGYLRELDVKNTNYTALSQYDNIYTDSLTKLMQEYLLDPVTGKEFNAYFAPYFCGAYSLIYSTQNSEVDSVVKENGFRALFDRSLYASPIKIGMYDTARWMVAAYLMSQGKNPNMTHLDGSTDGDIEPALQEEIIKALKDAHFDEFGNDALKRNVASGSLDLCFTQLGDFFDALYLAYSEGQSNIAFNVSIPSVSSAFFDAMVVPTTCQNYELANAFVDFMLQEDHAFQNAQAIGYSPCLKSVCDRYHQEAEAGAYYYGDENTVNALSLKDFLTRYPMYLDPFGSVSELYMFEPKSNDYLTTCEAIFNSLA